MPTANIYWLGLSAIACLHAGAAEVDDNARGRKLVRRASHEGSRSLPYHKSLAEGLADIAAENAGEAAVSSGSHHNHHHHHHAALASSALKAHGIGRLHAAKRHHAKSSRLRDDDFEGDHAEDRSDAGRGASSKGEGMERFDDMEDEIMFNGPLSATKRRSLLKLDGGDFAASDPHVKCDPGDGTMVGPPCSSATAGSETSGEAVIRKDESEKPLRALETPSALARAGAQAPKATTDDADHPAAGGQAQDRGAAKKKKKSPGGMIQKPAAVAAVVPASELEQEEAKPRRKAYDHPRRASSMRHHSDPSQGEWGAQDSADDFLEDGDDQPAPTSAPTAPP
eukprot:TRINITY_DN32715_c0_g2_i1.p1 TRINITY_DN32715_c0_g2~~TRINITY_DN32715_c0_g2_i1.p1  ORF type:complete len:361 (-),score=58.99 TRINITY_DN32715_c0_g2_i1:26-1042(-)